MSAIPFDALDYFEKLKAAGMSEQLARVQADAFRAFTERYEPKHPEDLATKDDIAAVKGDIAAIKDDIVAVKNDIAAVKNDVAAMKADLRETELRLQKEMQQMKYDLLKWQIAGFIALAAIMAKGFNWIGF